MTYYVSPARVRRAQRRLALERSRDRQAPPPDVQKPQEAHGPRVHPMDGRSGSPAACGSGAWKQKTGPARKPAPRPPEKKNSRAAHSWDFR